VYVDSVFDPAVAGELVVAIHTGHVEAVRRVVAAAPEIVSGPLGGPFQSRWALHIVAAAPEIVSGPLGGPFQSRWALHIVADWPGYFPNGPEIVRVLLAAGADPNDRNPGGETPLHWAASSDDADVAAALIDGGANMEVPDGSIGSPLDNAIGYACWHVASLLADRGARVDKLWHAAALGMLDRLQRLLDAGTSTSDEVSKAFWHACAAGQRRTAERLLAAGADMNWVPEYAEGTALDVAKTRGTRRDNVVGWLMELGASTANSEAGV